MNMIFDKSGMYLYKFIHVYTKFNLFNLSNNEQCIDPECWDEKQHKKDGIMIKKKKRSKIILIIQWEKKANNVIAFQEGICKNKQ